MGAVAAFDHGRGVRTERLRFHSRHAAKSIQSDLNAIANQQVRNQFGTQRYALLFEPGTYGSTADPLIFQVGYYTTSRASARPRATSSSTAPIDVYNQCSGTAAATRPTTSGARCPTSPSTSPACRLPSPTTGVLGRLAGRARCAGSSVNGNRRLMDYCDGSPDYASGGFIADSEFTGTVINGSQQQYIIQQHQTSAAGATASGTRCSAGDPGAPAQSFASNSAQRRQSYTTLATSPATEEEPYLYTDSAGTTTSSCRRCRPTRPGPTWAQRQHAGHLAAADERSTSPTPPARGADQRGAGARARTCCSRRASTTTPRRSRHQPGHRVIGLGFATLIPTAATSP